MSSSKKLVITKHRLYNWMSIISMWYYFEEIQK
jgi:hypothetical protein